MKQVAAGCLIGVGGLLAVAGGISWLLQTRYGHSVTGTLGVSALAGVVGWVGLNMLYSAVKTWRERTALAGGIAGVRPADGQGAVLVGTIEPLGPTVRAPFDGTECITYRYSITETRGSGRQRMILTHVKGVGLAPSAVVTASGTYKLLTVPELEASSPSRTATELADGFRRYALMTTFTGPDASAKELVERWTDADGAYRSDVAYAPLDAFELDKCVLEQQHVRPGTRVCVFGTFSSAKGGIVPSPSWAASPRLIEGSVDEVVATLGRSARNRFVAGILATTAAAGLVAAFIANG